MSEKESVEEILKELSALYDLLQIARRESVPPVFCRLVVEKEAQVSHLIQLWSQSTLSSSVDLPEQLGAVSSFYEHSETAKKEIVAPEMPIELETAPLPLAEEVRPKEPEIKDETPSGASKEIFEEPLPKKEKNSILSPQGTSESAPTITSSQERVPEPVGQTGSFAEEVIAPLSLEIPPEKNVEEPLIFEELLQRKLTTQIKKAISLNDRFRFRRELFSADDALMEECIAALEKATSLEEAETYLSTHFKWDNETEVVSDFMSIVKKRFAK